MKKLVCLVGTAVLLNMPVNSHATWVWGMKCYSPSGSTNTADCGSPDDLCPGTCYLTTVSGPGGWCTSASWYNTCNQISPSWTITVTTTPMNCVLGARYYQPDYCDCGGIAQGPPTTTTYIGDC